MDATPSPQSVGREFVRQYYTLLNRAPDHLHRFYNNQSSFVHDGLEVHSCREATLVIGQKSIHHKIQQLNFRDCHAKISQVDSQVTLGNGVVVQVTGELSNDGQPMRRFTQTFVLAAQSPKKYYVHNDIFRYQDVYLEDDADVENRSENDDDQSEQDANDQVSVGAQVNSAGSLSAAGQTQQLYYPMNVNAAAGVAAVAGQAANNAITPAAVSTQTAYGQPPQAAQINGAVGHDELLQGIGGQVLGQSTSAQPVAQASIQQQQAMIAQPAAVIESAVNVMSVGLNDKDNDSDKYDKSEIDYHNEPEAKSLEMDLQREEAVKVQSQPQSNEPKTYANLFKTESSNNGMSFASAIQTQPAAMNASITAPASSSSQSTIRPNPMNTTSYGARPQDTRNDNSSAGGYMNQRSNNNNMSRMNRERRPSNANMQYGDNQQLFVGGIPHHATEEELKTLFGQFGNVAEVRIHVKQMVKVPGSRLPPFYGFITYEDPESVQHVIHSCQPIYFPDNDINGVKLNVEEKKARMRTDMGTNTGAGSSSGGGNRMPVSGGNSGGPPRSGPNRSTSNTGGLMRGGNQSGSGGNGPPRMGGGGGGVDGRVDGRGGAGGPRGNFQRNDRSGPSGGGAPRNNGTANNTGSSYNRR